MKFVIYRGRKKITVDNAWMPDPDNLDELIDSSASLELSVSDLYNLQITSVQGLLEEGSFDYENAQIRKEIFDGIKWRQETIN